MNNIKLVVKKVVELVGNKKDAIIAGDLETLESRLQQLNKAKKELKSEFSTSDIKKIDTRIKWLSDEIDAINKEFLEDEKLRQQEEHNIKSVASRKLNNKKDVTPASNKDTKSTKTNKVEKSNKSKVEKSTTTNKVEDKETECNLSDIPVIVPNVHYYVTLETDETFRIIYKDDTTTVLLDNQGVIECDTSKFNKGLVFYSVKKQTYAFDIIRTFTK